MIEIKDKKDCCGCHACMSVCAHRAITMQTDAEGFLYPMVDKSLCTDCGMCELVCPVIHQSSSAQPLKVYAAKSNDEEVSRQSSSGGIFSLLAEAIIREGGVVFGAKFDEEWNVVHASTETLDGLAAFRGSKYVQSTIGNTYKEAKEFLKQGRKVLFTGTPCQIAGLKRFLRRNYDNLLAVDVICHGVPSPLVWQRYLSGLQQTLRTKWDVGRNKAFSPLDALPVITGISFRDKTNGRSKFGFRLSCSVSEAAFDSAIKEREEFIQPFSQNIYMKGFLGNLYLRPSCHHCPTKEPHEMSDVTLGDYWGIEKDFPDWNDDKGTSVVIVRSDKGMEYCHEISMKYCPAEFEKICKYNPALVSSYRTHRNRERFFSIQGSISSNWIERMLQPTLWERLNNKWYMIKRKIRTQNDSK